MVISLIGSCDLLVSVNGASADSASLGRLYLGRLRPRFMRSRAPVDTRLLFERTGTGGSSGAAKRSAAAARSKAAGSCTVAGSPCAARVRVTFARNSGVVTGTAVGPLPDILRAVTHCPNPDADWTGAYAGARPASHRVNTHVAPSR